MDLTHRTISRPAAAAMVDAMVAAGDGRLLITGQAGMGKSTLLEAAAARAIEAGALVLRASPSFAERSTSYSVLWDLLGCLDPASVGALRAERQFVLDVALGWERPDVELPAMATAIAVEGILEELSADRRVVLLIDDLQWSDPESLAAIERATRRVRSLGVSIVATSREIPSWHGTSTASAFVGAEMLVLEGLSVRELEVLALAAWPSTITRAQVAALREHTGGNPMWALELIERGVVGDLAAVPVGALPAPPSLAVVSAHRLRALGAAAADIVSIVALIGHPPLSLLGEVLEFSRTDPKALDEAEAAGFLSVTTTGVRTRHPLHASAAIARLGPVRRRELHAFIALAVNDVVVRAQHLQLSQPPGPDETIAVALATAAVELRRRGARLRSAHFDAQSVERTELTDPHLPDRLLNQAQQLFSAGDYAACMLAVGRVSVPGLDAHQYDWWLALSVSCLLGSDGPAGAARFLEEQGRGQASLPRQGIIEAVVVDVTTITAEARVARAEGALAALVGVRAPNAVHAALRAAVTAGIDRGSGLDAIRITEMDRLQSIEIVVGLEHTGLATTANLAHLMDDVSSSSRAFAELAAWARNEGKEGIERIFTGNAAHAALVGDDIPAARALFDASGYRSDAPSLPRALRTPAGLLLIADARYDELARLVGGWAQETHVDPLDTRRGETLLGLSDVARHRWGEAVAHLRAAAELADAAGIVELGSRLRIDLPLVEALLHTGALDEARNRLDIVREFLLGHERPISRIALQRISSLESASRGDLGNALRHADDAITLAVCAHRPTDEASALLQRARVLRRLRRVADARADVAAARERAIVAGDRSLLDQVELDHGAGGSGRATGELTRAELGVLKLLREGWSNREIAAHLFIGVRTVESHVAALLRKTGLSTRARLIARVD